MYVRLPPASYRCVAPNILRPITRLRSEKDESLYMSYNMGARAREHWRPLGVGVSIDREEQKLENETRTGIIIGYAQLNAHQVLNVEDVSKGKFRITITRDARPRVGVFPFRELGSPMDGWRG